MQGRTYRDNWETMPKERMSGISDLDLGGIVFIWVLEEGIEL